MSDSHIVDNFKIACLQEIKERQEKLELLFKQHSERLDNQAALIVDSLSNSLIQLQDKILKALRKKIKTAFDSQNKQIFATLKAARNQIQQKILQEKNQLEKMKKSIEQESMQSKRILSKFAKGKIQSQQKQFDQEIRDIVLNPRQYIINTTQIKILAQEIVQLLKVKNRRGGMQSSLGKSKLGYNTSAISNYSHRSYYTPSQNKKYSDIEQVKQTKSQAIQDIDNSQNIDKNQQDLQQKQVQQCENGTTAIEEYKQMKSIRKKRYYEQCTKRQSPDSKKAGSISNLAALIIQRQKLLKELQ